MHEKSHFSPIQKDSRSAPSRTNIGTGIKKILFLIFQYRELKTAVRKFNQKPKKGLEQFILHNYVDDSPKSITKFLLNQKGLSKSAIGELLGEPDQKYLDILGSFYLELPV